MTDRKKPTEAELGILRVLWTRGPSTVREVAETMGREGAYTTVLKLLQIIAAELRVSDHNAARVDERDAPRECRTRSVGEGIGVRPEPPLCRNETGLALELSSSFLCQGFPQPTSRNDDDACDEQKNQPEEPEEKPFGECHAERDCPPLRR